MVGEKEEMKMMMMMMKMKMKTMVGVKGRATSFRHPEASRSNQRQCAQRSSSAFPQTQSKFRSRSWFWAAVVLSGPKLFLLELTHSSLILQELILSVLNLTWPASFWWARSKSSRVRGK